MTSRQAMEASFSDFLAEKPLSGQEQSGHFCIFHAYPRTWTDAAIYLRRIMKYRHSTIRISMAHAIYSPSHVYQLAYSCQYQHRAENMAVTDFKSLAIEVKHPGQSG